MVNLFKSIILFSYSSFVAFFFLPYLDVYVYEQETLDALSWTGYGAILAPNTFMVYALFDSGATSRINVGHFMAELILNKHTWQKWKGQMPIIYNNA
jgi:hypothetical protein